MINEIARLEGNITALSINISHAGVALELYEVSLRNASKTGDAGTVLTARKMVNAAKNHLADLNEDLETNKRRLATLKPPETAPDTTKAVQ